MKHLIFILFILLFCSFVQGKEISVSPTNLTFMGNTNEKICKEIIIKTDISEKMVISDKWSEKGVLENLLYLHKYDSNKFELDLEYPKEIIIESKKAFNVCITGKNPGQYHGAFLIRIKGKPLQIGIWLNVILEGQEKMLLTGKTIDDGEFVFEKGKYLVLLFLIIFISLLIIKKRMFLKKNT